MQSVEKAVWFIENNFRSDISLADVAAAISLSKFHLVRSFDVCTGFSVNGYIRARRLSEAAKALVNNSDTILDIALGVGYNSHEAFTRAFRQWFGITPDQVRKARSLEMLALVEPLRMTKTDLPSIDDPIIKQLKGFSLAGLTRRYNSQSSAAMAAQWQDFAPHIGHIPQQSGQITFGVLHNSDDGEVDYLTGVEVAAIDDLPNGLEGLHLVGQTYAVFVHEGHVSTIFRTWQAIFQGWLQDNADRMINAPQFERYDDRFDPMTGNGVVEIWIPVTP